MKLQKVGSRGLNAIDDPPLILEKAAEFVHFHQREILHRAHDFLDLVQSTQSNFKVAAAAHGLPLASLALVTSALVQKSCRRIPRSPRSMSQERRR
jgi:hypothetical protein